MIASRIFVTRRLPEAVEEVLAGRLGAQLCDADTNAGGGLSRAQLASAMADFDILLPTITNRLDAALLRPGSRVKLIANFGAGVEHIDLDAARAAGIIVTNTPDALTETTAELALTLMLMAARRAGEGERLIRSGGWTGWGPSALMGQGLAGKLLGLVGYGRIAGATASRARVFGMKIAYFSRSTALDVGDAVRFDSLSELAEAADVLSLHVPGGLATRHMIDAALLAKMKPTSILINTARGSVVDEAALAAALATGRIAAAGLDVFEAEPRVHPALMALENAVLLPHLGSATLECRTAMGMQAIANIDAFLSGQDPPNRVA